MECKESLGTAYEIIPSRNQEQSVEVRDDMIGLGETTEGKEAAAKEEMEYYSGSELILAPAPPLSTQKSLPEFQDLESSVTLVVQETTEMAPQLFKMERNTLLFEAGDTQEHRDLGLMGFDLVHFVMKGRKRPFWTEEGAYNDPWIGLEQQQEQQEEEKFHPSKAAKDLEGNKLERTLLIPPPPKVPQWQQRTATSYEELDSMLRCVMEIMRKTTQDGTRSWLKLQETVSELIKHLFEAEKAEFEVIKQQTDACMAALGTSMQSTSTSMEETLLPLMKGAVSRVSDLESEFDSRERLQESIKLRVQKLEARLEDQPKEIMAIWTADLATFRQEVWGAKSPLGSTLDTASQAVAKVTELEETIRSLQAEVGRLRGEIAQQNAAVVKERPVEERNTEEAIKTLRAEVETMRSALDESASIRPQQGSSAKSAKKKAQRQQKLMERGLEKGQAEVKCLEAQQGASFQRVGLPIGSVPDSQGAKTELPSRQSWNSATEKKSEDLRMQVDQLDSTWDTGSTGWPDDKIQPPGNQQTSYAAKVMHGRTDEKDLKGNEFQTVRNKKDQKIEAKVQDTIEGKAVERSWKQRQAQKVRELVPQWDGNLSTATPEERLARLFMEEPGGAREGNEGTQRRQSEEVAVFRMAAPKLTAQCREAAKEALKVICREMGRPKKVQWNFLDMMLVSPTAAEIFLPASQGPLFREVMGAYLVPEDQIKLGEADIKRRAGVYRGGYFLGLRQAALSGLTQELQIGLLEQLLVQPALPSKHRNLRASVAHDLAEIRKRGGTEPPIE